MGVDLNENIGVGVEATVMSFIFSNLISQKVGFVLEFSGLIEVYVYVHIIFRPFFKKKDLLKYEENHTHNSNGVEFVA